MSFGERFSHLTATGLALIKTRCELAAVEVEEEVRRYMAYILLAICAVGCALLAVLLLVLLIIVLCWESYRVAAIGSLLGFFVIVSVILYVRLRSMIANKPKLLELTREEISKDIERLKDTAK